jgi:hypothetical protein
MEEERIMHTNGRRKNYAHQWKKKELCTLMEEERIMHTNGRRKNYAH